MSKPTGYPFTRKKTSRLSDGLKLVTTPENATPKQEASLPTTLPSARNFFNTCPRQLEFLPTEPCAQGEESTKCKNEAGMPCQWAIDSGEHYFCFWKWVHENSLPNGQMKPMLQNETAVLLGCSSTKIHFTIKDGVEKLKTSRGSKILAELAGGSDSEGASETEVNEIVSQIESRVPSDDE